MNRRTLSAPALALALLGAGAARAADAPFAIGAPLAGRAVFGCAGVTVQDGSTVRSEGVSSYSAKEGQAHVASNGDVLVNSRATILGDATAGPGHLATVAPDAAVSGLTRTAAAAVDCAPVDLPKLAASLASNDNARIPKTALGRSALQGAAGDALVLAAHDSVALPAGTFVFSSIDLSERAHVTVAGDARVLVTGSVRVTGNSFLNPAGGAFRLRLFVAGPRVSVEALSTIGAFVIAPSADVLVGSESRVLGTIFAKTVTVREASAVIRLVDDTPPVLTLIEPAGADLPSLAAVRVRGFARDPETAVTLARVNGNLVGLKDDGSFDTTMDLTVSNEVRVDAENAMGLVATVRVNLCSGPPAVAVLSPAAGSLVGSRIGTVSGTFRGAVSVAVNGRPAVLGDGTFRLDGFDFGPDGVVVVAVVASNACAQSSVASVFTLDTAPPAVTIDTPTPGAVLASSPVAVSGTFVEPNLAGITVNGVEAAISGNRFTAAAVTIPPGPSTLVAEARDRLGRVGVSAPVSVTLDTQSALVVITSPVSGALTADGTATVSGTANVTGLAGVRVNGRPAAVAGTIFTVSGVPLAEGDNRLVAEAIDSASRSFFSQPVFVTLDSLPPDVALDVSSFPLLTRLSSINVSGTASDPHLGGVTVNGVAAVVSAGRFTAANVPLAEGVNSIRAHAVDTLGHAADSAPATVDSDTQAPTVTITSPAPNAQIAASSVTVTGTALDAHLAGVTVNGVAAVVSGGQFAAQLTLADGDATLVARATDTVGNAGASAGVNVTLDTLPPVVSIDAPADPLTGSAFVTVTGTVVEPHLLSLTVAGAPAVVSGGRFVATNVPLVEGTQRITAVAFDTFGHRAESSAVEYRLDSTPPVLTMDAPAPDSAACRAPGPPVAVWGRVYGRSGARPAVTLDARSAAGTTLSFTAALDAVGTTWTVPAVDLGSVDGTATLTATTSDALEHDVRVLRTFRIKASSPSLTLLLDGGAMPGSAAGPAAASGETPVLFGRALSPRASVSDASGGASPTPVVTLDGAPWAGSPISAEGTHLLSATATDCAAHSASAHALFTIDVTPPRLLTFVPADGATLGAAVASVSGTSDPDLAGATVNGAAAIVSGGAFSVTPFSSKEGVNAASIVLVDRAGNRSTFPRSFSVKTLGPSVEILESGAPLGTGARFFRSVAPTVRSNDPSATVLATLNGVSFLSGTSISVSGDYTLSATASDSLGHSSSASASFKIDLTPGPAVDITAPADRAILPGPTVAVTGTASASVTSVSVNGRAATLTGATWSLSDLVLPPDMPTEIVAIAADAAGRTASATRQVTVRSSGPQIAILEPADGMRTNRKKIDVAGAVVGGPSATANGQVTVAGRTLALDALGTFRAKDVVLQSGANTIMASATDPLGRTGTASVTVTTDTTAPGIAITADGQPLAEGASFARPFSLRVTITDDAVPTPVPTIRLNGQDKGARAAVTDLPIAQTGGYVISVAARDAAGNESRADRSFTLASGGCAVSALDPGEGAVVAAAKVTLKGRSGEAASVTVTSGGQTFAAQLADGTFAAGDVPLAAVGDNTLSIACTDRAGVVSTTSLRVTRLQDGAGPVVRIVQPAGGARQSAATVAVSGTVSDPAAAVTVNGVNAPVSSGAFSAGPLPLVEGPNVLAARAVDAAGRSGEDRVVVFRDSAAPKVAITSPPDGAHVGKPGTGPAVVNVSGIVDLTSEPNLASVVVATGAGSVTATVDSDTGAFYAGGVPLLTTSPGAPQNVTATATDALAHGGAATVSVIYDPAAPALVLAQPVDGTRWSETSPPSFAASGEVWAKDGALVSINGGGLDGLTWDAAGADGRRHASFTAQVTVPAAEGPFGVIARVEEPSGAYANDKRLLFKDVTAPTVVDMQPADGAKQVDANEIPLILFSETIRPSSLSAADGLTLTRVATSEKAVGTFTVAGSAVAFAPGAAMVRGEAYKFRAGAGITDLVGHPLAAVKEVRFTVAAVGTGAPPVLDPLPPVVCAPQLVVAGTAIPNAAVRVRDGSLSLTGNADGAGRFAVTISLSGNGWHAVHAAVLDSGGTAGPEIAALFRVDCSAPAVVGATFDRATGKIVVAFSEAITSAALTVGGAGSAITVSKADDATNAPQSATLSVSTDGLTATLDLGNGASAWWTNVSVRLSVGPPAADAAGNAMAAPFSTVFFAGGGGDLSGGFLSGAALDDESGRPLAGADARLYASDAALPGAVLPGQVTPAAASTITDGRGRFSLAGDIAAGRYALVLSRTGYTRAVRRLALEPAVGAVPFGSRLTPLAAQAAGLLVPTTGGSFAGPAGSSATVDFASNALVAVSSLGVRLTPLSGQGLPEPLPLGWSPLVAAELRLIPNGAGDDALPEGAGTPFTAGGVTLTLPLPTGIITADLYAARYDVAAGAWLALPLPVFVLGGGGVPDRARVALAGPGSVAIIAPDADAATRPLVMPVSLDAPLVGVALPSLLPTLTATIALDPPIVSATGRATARVVAKSSDGVTPLPSGLAVQGYLDEKLVVSGGGELYEAPFTADLILYHPPLSASDLGGAAPAAAGALTFRISPSPRAAQVLLDTGYENVRLFPYTDQLERGQVLGPAGGSVTTADGVELFVPEGGLAQKTVVNARKLTAAELAALPPVPGYTTVAGVRVSLSGAALARAATLRLNAPAGLPADAADDPRYVLAAFVDQPADGRGAFANAVSRVTLLPAAGAVPAKLVASPEASGSLLPFPGLAGEGLFLFLHASAPVGFVTGRVAAPNGAGIAGSRVTAVGLGTANLSVPGGPYAVPAPAGAPTLNALHPVLGIGGSGQVPSLGKGQIATLDLVLSPVPPQIRSLQPTDGAVDQPVGSTVAVAFSAALDPASVTAATLAVSLADAAGAPTGLLWNGAVALSPDRTTVVFTPARPLPPGRRIAARFVGGVRDAVGTAYGGTLPVDWSFTTSTQFVTGGSVHPEKIRILVPVNGVAQVIGDPGAVPAALSGTTPWSVIVDVDGPLACPSVTTVPANSAGGFTLVAGCPPTATVTLTSRVYIHILDPTGAEAATFKLGPFTTPDGKGFIAQPGEATVFTSAEGVEVTAPAAAFDVPTLVKVTKQPLDSLAVPLNDGMEMGAVLDVDFEGTAKETLRLRVPVTTSAPTGGLVFAGSPIELPWGRKLRILDVGRLVTDASGNKYISTADADQPDDPALTSGGRAAFALPKKLVRTILLEMGARATVGLIYGATTPLMAVSGVTNAVGATFFVLYNALADTFVFLAIANNWQGQYILPAVAGRPFSVIKRDSAAGWILGQHDYPAPAASTGITSLGTLEPSPKTPPMLIGASPFRVMRFTAPPVDAVRAVDTLRLSLEVEARVGYDRKASLRSVPTFPLPDRSSVEFFNFTQATAASPSGSVRAQSFVVSGTFTGDEIAAAPGDDLYAFVMPGELDPSGVKDITLTFSRPLVDPGDPASLFVLTDCGALPDPAPSVPASCSGSVVKVNPTAELTGGSTNLVIHLPGRLANGHQFRLELKGIKAGISPVVDYAKDAPATFFFSTAATGTVMGRDTAQYPLGDTYSARDLLKFGNLLLVGSATGQIVAVDVSNPAAPTAFARLNGKADAVRAFATDGHGRLFYNAQFGSTWAVKTVRIEDVREHSETSSCPVPDGWGANPPPCFAAVPGGIRTAFSNGSVGTLLGSDYLSLVGTLPTGTPAGLEILVRDDYEPSRESEPYDLRELYERQPDHNPGDFDKITPKPADGFYEFEVSLDTAGHLPGRPDSSCGKDVEKSWDHYQRVSVDNVSTGNSWSMDVENPWPGASGSPNGKGKLNIRGRDGDRLRIRYNVFTLGYLAIVGSGISILDLNRGYRTPAPAVDPQRNKSECDRRLGKLEGQDLAFYAKCPPPANAADAKLVSRLNGLENTPALAVVVPPQDIDPKTGKVIDAETHIYSVLTHMGSVHSSSSAAEPGKLDIVSAASLPEWQSPAGAACFATRVPPPLFASYRAVALAKNITWQDRSVTPSDFSPEFFAAPAVPVSVTSDLLFYSLGSGGILSFRLLAGGRWPTLVGRYWAKDHTVYRLQADSVRGLLFAGGQDKDGNPIIDVWDMTRANGGPTADGVFPPANGIAVDPRLVTTLMAPWDTNHIGLDETGLGLIYTWGYRPTPPAKAGDPPGREEGGFVVAFDSPSFTFSGVYRARTGATAPGVVVPSLQRLSPAFDPLGIPLRVLPADEDTNRSTDEFCASDAAAAGGKCHTAAFKVHLSLPGYLGEAVTAKVQSLRALPDRKLLGREDLGPLVAACGGVSTCDTNTKPSDSGWPERDVWVTLRRIGKADPSSSGPSNPNGPTTNPYDLYESDETVVLVADPRARAEYRATVTEADAKTKADEKNQCRRCDRPAYLPQDASDTKVLELLAGGPYVRAFLSPKAGSLYEANTNAAINAFTKPGYARPTGFAALSGFADEVPSPMQLASAEPAQNPAVWTAEAGASVRLTSGEGVVEARDFSAAARTLGFAFDRTYRSGVAGYGPLGAAGWNASLFAHLREVHLGAETHGESYVDYHDGAGQVWRFIGIPDTKTDCPAGTDRDEGEAYCAPNGLTLNLRKGGDGRFQLLGRNNEVLRFEANGRLVQIRDRHVQKDDNVGKQGSTVSLFYTPAGDVARVEDEMGRVYRFTYFDDPDPSKGDVFGLLKQIEDFATPARKIAFTYNLRRLETVTLPFVTNKPNLPRAAQGAPVVTYSYLSNTVLSSGAPLHGTAFSKLKLNSFTLPGSLVPRMSFAWDSANGHAFGLSAPERAAWALLFIERTAAPVSSVSVTEPSGLLSTYTLENGRIATRLRSLPVAKGGKPVNAVVSDSATYETDGRLKTVTRGDGGTTTFDLPAKGVLLKRNNATSSTDTGVGGTRLWKYAYQGDNFVSSIQDSLPVPRTTLTGVGSVGTPADIGFPTDNVKGSNAFDAFGRASTFTGDQLAVVSTFGTDSLGRDGGFPDTVSQGAISQTLKYDPDDQRGNPTTVESSWKVSSAIEYDEWDRPVKETRGKSNGSYSPVEEVVERAFDAAGHLVTEKRRRQGLGFFQTDYFYNDRELLRSVKRTQVAGLGPGSLAPFAETKLTYKDSGFLDTVTTPAGVVTTYEFDEAGRMKAVIPPLSGRREFGYDEMGRLTYATDGDVGVWMGSYDEWGGLVSETLPTGAVISRTFDPAGGLVSARLNDGKGGGDLALVDGVYVTSFGETKSLTQRMSGNPDAPALAMTRDFDGNGRLVRQSSSGRKDLELGYEAVTGRVSSVADSTRQLTFDYKSSLSPWADSLKFGEAQTAGAAGAFVPSTVVDILGRDAYGRPTAESRSDGTNRQTTYDEAGNPTSIVDGTSATTLSWDSRGNLLTMTRPGPQGSTTYGYDLDGRIKVRHSIAGASGQAFDTSYDYEPGTGRLQKVTRPDGATETYFYNSDDTVQSVVRSDGATLTYIYDPANRVTKRTGQGGSVIPGGETFTWDIASRLGSATRVNDKGDPISGTAVVMSGYDLAGRPQSETVGARAALTRDYDVFGHVTSLGLPSGVGAFGALSYLRAYEPGTQRLSSLTATGDAPSVPGVALASLGAKWAWLGEDRLLGVTSNGPLGAAHRFGYVGGPGGPAGAAKWKLGTLTIGTAGGSDPFADAGLPLGDDGGKGSKPWGQFAYGYVTGASGDGTKLGRQVTGTGLPLGSILAGQGWAYGIDPSKRLKGAFAGPGDVRGIDAGGAAAAIAAFERFTYDYGTADQLNSQTREVAVKTVAYETGGEGRPDSRKADAGPKLAFSYDAAKRRTSDDRFTYEWHWHGKLASAAVKPCWTIENGESQDPGCPAGYTRPPYADQKIAYEYDTLGRLLTRTHLGVLPTGETADSKRPFIEKRAYLWDDKVLLAETAYADPLETQIRWRKSFIPGASLDDHVQLRVETYDLSGRSVATDRLYSYLRDEQNTVLGLADETSAPVKPSTPLRYLYTPYGDAHAETGPETRRAAYQSDITSVTKPDTTVATQTIADPTHFLGGAIRITTSADLDQGTFNTIAVERLDSSVWTPLTGGEFVTGRGTTATNAQLDVLPLAGFELGKSYRVRVATGLHDVGGRQLSDARVLTFTLPDPVPPDQIGTLSFAYERIFPVNYDSYFASGTDAGLIPGGQPMLFQGAWTDPVTGLQYKRERFYDPRNVSWLSQDPLGDIDSPNLYGFVGARPHEKTDPLGLGGAPYPCGMRPCDPREQTGGEWLGENVLAPAARAYEGAWDIVLRATGGNQADREFVEIATGLGLFKGLRVAEGSAFLARRSLQGVGKALDRIPVNAREFSPSTFGVGNIQREEKAAGQIAERIGQRALPTAEDFPWSKYQRHVTGVDYEEMWRLNQKRLGVDAKTAGYTVEAKWAGKNPAAWRSSPYNPSSELYDEANILDQARRLLELNKQTSGKGVRYALSNEPSAKHFMELFEKTFPEETKAGTLKVWVVPGNGM